MTTQLKSPKRIWVCFYILENEVNFGSKLPVPISIATLLENRVTGHLISEIKPSLCKK